MRTSTNLRRRDAALKINDIHVIFMLFFLLATRVTIFAGKSVKHGLSDKTGCRNATGYKKSHRRPRLGRRFALSAALTAPDILTMAEVGCKLWCGISQGVCL